MTIAHQLHAALSVELLRRCQKPGKVPVELLSVARGFLQDHGLLGAAQDAADRARLQALYRLYCTRIEEALSTGTPRATVIAEVRHFLHAQGMAKDLGGAITSAQAVRALGSAALPFTTTKTRQ